MKWIILVFGLANVAAWHFMTEATVMNTFVAGMCLGTAAGMFATDLYKKGKANEQR